MPGKNGSGGIELGAEVDGGGVLKRGGLMVHAHRECAGGEVGDEVDGRQVEVAQQGARVVGAGEFFSDNSGHGGLGAVGEQFDGSDEVFFSGRSCAKRCSAGSVCNPTCLAWAVRAAWGVASWACAAMRSAWSWPFSRVKRSSSGASGAAERLAAPKAAARRVTVARWRRTAWTAWRQAGLTTWVVSGRGVVPYSTSRSRP